MGIRIIYSLAVLFSIGSGMACAQATQSPLPNETPTVYDGHHNEKEDKSRLRELSGVVRDQNGAPVENAIVQLKDLKSEKVVDFITKQNGKYEFHDLSMDIDYELTAKRDGYDDSAKKKLSKYDSRKPATLNFELQGKKKTS